MPESQISKSSRWVLPALLAMSLTASLAHAQTTGSSIMPQFAFGGGWYSALYFSNQTAATATFAVNFIADDGTPLKVPALGGSTVQVSVPANGTTLIEAPNSGASGQGYASFTLPYGVSGYGVFRFYPSGGATPQEAVVPFSSSSLTVDTLTWDETVNAPGSSTAVAIVNPSPATASIAVTAWRADGSKIGAGTVNLDPYRHTAMMLPSLSGLSGMAGNKGIAQFVASGGSVAVLGLRARASAITSIPTGASSFAFSVPDAYAIKPGLYNNGDTNSSGMNMIVSGPGVNPDGTAAWAFNSAPNTRSCTYPTSGVVFSGPPASNPMAGRLSAAGITSSAMYYGIASGSLCSPGIPTGSLVGMAPTGNGITISVFTDWGGKDHPAPVDQVTYTLTSASPLVPTSSTAIRTGTYLGPGNENYPALVEVSGPGATVGGMTGWSIGLAPGAHSCTYPTSAGIQSGPAVNNPVYARLQAAKATISAALSYGTGTGNRCSPGLPAGSLVGAVQAGDAVAIVGYTSWDGKDHSAPVFNITFTRKSD